MSSPTAECSKSFISVNLCQRGNQRQWNAAVFFYGHVMQPFFPRMLRCTLHTRGLWIYVLFPDAEESTGLNDEQAASALLPIKKLIVCPSRKGNDPLGFSLYIFLAHNNSNPTAFDFVCLHTESMPVNLNSLFRCLSVTHRSFSLGNFCSHLWHLKTYKMLLVQLSRR